MAEEDGSENLLQKLYTKQLSLSWDVLSNTQSLLFMGERVLIIRLQDQQQLALEEVELSTALDHRANTSKETEMADEKATPKPDAIFLADADRVEKLLDIIQNTVEMPNVPCIRAAAQNELAQIEEDLRAQMYPEIVAAEKKAAEERQKAEEERQKRLKEEQEKERERQAKLSDEEKKKAQPDSWVPPRDTQAHPNQERRV